MKKFKKILVLSLSMIALLAMLSGCGKPEEETENVITNFGTFESKTFEGETVTEEVFKNAEVTMINVWGTFCSPCIHEMPDLEKISQTYKEKGFQLIGLVSDNDTPGAGTVKQIIEQTGTTYTHIMNSQELSSGILSAVQAVPTTIFVDKKGKILQVVVGGKNYEQWSEIVSDVMESVK